MPSKMHRLHAALTQLAAQDVPAGQIADAAALTWREIQAALSPIIGTGGVQALYARTLFLTRAAHPWLAATYDRATAPDDYAGLRAALVQQTGAVAVAAHAALLQNFCDLLASLIGESLTERLLGELWDNLSSGNAVQDTAP